jgi:hypothetical protein
MRMFLFRSHFVGNWPRPPPDSSSRRPPIVQKSPEVDASSEARSPCYSLVKDRARPISISSLSDPILPMSTTRSQVSYYDSINNLDIIAKVLLMDLSAYIDDIASMASMLN